MSTSSRRALASCSGVKGQGDTHIHRGGGLHVRNLKRYCQGMLCFEVDDGFDELVQVHVASAEVSVRTAIPRLVAHLLCNRQVLRVVRDGLGNAP